MGDKAKPLVSWAGGFAVWTQPFCARGHIAQHRSEIRCGCVWHHKAGDRPPYGQKAQTPASNLQGCRGLLFT